MFLVCLLCTEKKEREDVEAEENVYYRKNSGIRKSWLYEEWCFSGIF